ncbi:MAG TPA: NAD(P)H-hydrate dehydratase [Acidimicrobiia bacterium]|jgi:NAD(P)H-hydrate epimerase
MRPLVTPAEMAEADRRTIASGTPESVLMERAGRAVAWAVRSRCGGTYARHAIVVCGKGNNGGDGLVTARALRAWGMRVDVFALESGIDRVRLSRALGRADVVVDAMFGTGFHGALEGDAAWIAEAIAAAPVGVVAVDIPSGVDGLTGATDGPVVDADRTVTFAATKPGLVFQPGRSHAGTVTVADIGIAVAPAAAGITEESDVAAWLPPRQPSTHKWEVGGLMVVGGTTGMTGAPMFVSHAAMRAGAGIVWCGVPGSAAAAAGSGTEVITVALPAAPDGSLDARAAGAVLRDLGRFGAIVVGPGLGGHEGVQSTVSQLVADAPVPMVLDADGLNALRGDLSPLRVRHTMLAAPTVLTPHDGEYTRLVGEPPGVDRIEAARRLATAADAVVLLKGAATVIAEPGPGGRTAVNTTGGPWLATAGTGDVLSGIIGAFLARGTGAFEAASAGAWVHGRAADRAGHTGMIAGDLVAAIPAALPPMGEN